MDHQSAIEQPTSVRPVSFVSSKKQPSSDHPRALSASRSAEGTVEIECDQAIFTSQKSPMGEGYRIVAASPGIRPEEKAEITRRSPSHGALASNSPQGEGMLAYPLPTGRFCVCHCKHDGVEHTARGGQRVRTHVAILDPRNFRLFDDNLFAVHQALASVPVEAARAFNPSMGRLCLKSVGRYSPPRYLASAGGPEAFLRVTRALMSEEHCVLASVPEARPTLQWALMMLPISMRAERSISVGIKFSLARNLTTTIIHQDFERVQQMIVGQSIRWRDLKAEALAYDSQYDDWIEFISRRADQGRLHEISILTGQMDDKATQISLARIARLCQDRDAAESIERDVLVVLQNEYERFAARNELESRLAGELLGFVESRLAQMDEDAQEGDDSLGPSAPAPL